MTDQLEYATVQASTIIRYSIADMHNVPIYIFAHSQCPQLLGARADWVRGQTSPVFDLLLRGVLDKMGRWQGRGFGCVVNDESLLKSSADDVDFQERFLSTVLHETSHYLAETRTELQTTLVVDDLPEDIRPAASLCDHIDAHEVDTLSADAKRCQKYPSWHMHGDRFIRCSAHVRHRAMRLGFSGQSPWFAGRMYRLSDAAWYLSALHDEVYDREAEPIRDILASDPPEEFAELWREDTWA